MVYRLLAAGVFTHEGQGGCEDGLPSLASLHGARRERFALSYVFHVVEYGDRRVASKNKVAVHAVDGEMGGNGELRGRKALGDDRAAIDTAGSRRVPQGASVGENILLKS